MSLVFAPLIRVRAKIFIRLPIAIQKEYGVSYDLSSTSKQETMFARISMVHPIVRRRAFTFQLHQMELQHWLPSHFTIMSPSTFTTTKKSTSSEKESNELDSAISQQKNKKDQLYLHVAPDGDYWTSGEIFAAKHLQPDYVKSIAIPYENEMNILRIIEGLEHYDDLDILMKDVYDTGDLSLLLNTSSIGPTKRRNDGQK